MKKTLIILSIVLVLLIGTLLAIPVFFKENLLDATKATINKHINAKVEFADFNLSLFQNFPKATVELKDVIIVGKGEFQKDTLLNVSFIQATMSLTSVFKKTGIQIEKVSLDKPLIKLLVKESGKANWDLTNSESEALNNNSQNQSSGSNGFEMQLEQFNINNASFFYDDKATNMNLALTNINFAISGEMFGTTTALQTKGTIDDINVNYGNINYVANTSLETQTKLNVDYEKMVFAIAENEILLNNLVLELNGKVETPSDSMVFDLDLKTKESDFKNFLALIPKQYESYLEDVKTSGTAAIKGKFKGHLYNESYPAFTLGLDIKDGNFQYAELPEQIKNIKADVLISKPQGELNLTEVKITEAHAEVKNSPVDLTLEMNNLIEDPWFDGAFIGKVNFDHLKDVLPLDSVNIAGMIDANLFVKGNYSAIEKEEYNKIKSDGIVLLDNFIYESQDLSQKVFVSKGQLNFSPQNINLQEFRMKIGQSDFNLSGKVSNYLNYLLKDGTLKGNLQLNSRLINLNEILRLQIAEDNEVAENKTDETSEKNISEEEEILTFDIPEDIDISFRSQIENAVFDRVPISNINGLITAKEGKLNLDGLNMSLLDGELKVNGSYQNTPSNQPLVDFGIDIMSIDIPATYQSLSGIQRMIPVAGHSQGRLSSSLKMNGRLSSSHKLIASTINGNGLFNTQNLEILNSPIFNQLKGILKAEKLKRVSIDDFKANFTVDNGNIQLKPFKTKVAGQETTVLGTLSAENLINMQLNFNVERDAFGPDIQNILSVIPGNKNITVVPAGVIITGPVGKPDVKMDLSETRKTITDATKDDLQKTINKLGDGLKKLFK